jgi:hypothetical protein
MDMYFTARITTRMLFTVMIGALLTAPEAVAGIPQPSLLLYGKVFDEAERLLTSGQLSWTFTPADGGPPVEVLTPLRPIEGPDGIYSYRVLVPLEAAVAGFPVSSGALPVVTAAVEYEQAGAVLNTGVHFTQTIILSMADTGSAKRVDICQNCERANAMFHSADINQDLKFSLSEFLRVLELHAATPGHDYHFNADSEDGYGVGPGPKSTTPHHSDYYGGANWRITVHELVRMVDLFTATPDHSYHPYPGSEDGFRKGAPAAAGKALLPSNTKQGDQDLFLWRTVRGGLRGQGDVLTITLGLEGSTGDELSGFGISETLPEGWTYLGSNSSPAPVTVPAAGSTGTLEFAWYPVPQGPFAFSYQVAFNNTETLMTDVKSIQGEGVYRTKSLEGQTLLAITPPKGASGGDDTDGDGIDDEIEEHWARVFGGNPIGEWVDSDGDGIPDILDEDSDNDGLSDFEEANFNGSPIYDPYHPVLNPGGTDLNTTKTDTDGDGVLDPVEIARESDPIARDQKPTGMPVGGRVALVLLTALFALILRREAQGRNRVKN